ncbi:hypothetical protein GONAM_15_00870 [Gordonia namibiensis NBRC 108229]|uniref:Uncharacterized protein n=1 Tax=Gordonia namibiensis NBRC 108229 TaxID=1208314 RepID=K6XNJ1_9ACTN|nr:hypothetical protein GONAM_15_00870 [Gordonia namibiensis NBRC 108229]
MPASRLAQASDHSFFDITPTGYVRSAGTSPSLAPGDPRGPWRPDHDPATLRSDEFARWSHFVALQGLRTHAQIPRLSAECDSLNSEL